MNTQQVRINESRIPLKPMVSLTPTERNEGDSLPPQIGEIDPGSTLTGSNRVRVLIVSCDPFVTDFLRGLVAVHGYDTELVTDSHEALVRVRRGLAHVVFIDDACFGIANFKTFKQRSQELIQEGVPVILLTDVHTKQHLQQLSTIKFFGIVRKPVGYLQISQVMADLMTL